MLDWILRHLGVIIFLAIFLSQIVRALLRSRKVSTTHEAQRDETAEARRVREVQEQIRRQIAERRAGRGTPAALPPVARQPVEPPVPRPHPTQMPERFGGPLGRMLEELQKRAQPPPPPIQAPVVHVENRHTAEIARQERLREELEALEEARLLAKRRANHLAAERQSAAESEPALRSLAQQHVLADLGDPQSLQRAFVLREVLGPPVGLR